MLPKGLSGLQRSRDRHNDRLRVTGPLFLCLLALLGIAFAACKEKNYRLPGVQYEPGPKGRAVACVAPKLILSDWRPCAEICVCTEYGYRPGVPNTVDDDVNAAALSRGCSRVYECPRKKLSFVCRFGTEVTYFYEPATAAEAFKHCEQDDGRAHRMLDKTAFLDVRQAESAAAPAGDTRARALPPGGAQGVQEEYSPPLARFSFAGGGLRLRAEPHLKGKQTGLVPKHAKVLVQSCIRAVESIDGRSGSWCRASYAGNLGWAFDAFLRESADERELLAQFERTEVDARTTAGLDSFTITKPRAEVVVGIDAWQQPPAKGDTEVTRAEALHHPQIIQSGDVIFFVVITREKFKTPAGGLGAVTPLVSSRTLIHVRCRVPGRLIEATVGGKIRSGISCAIEGNMQKILEAKYLAQVLNADLIFSAPGRQGRNLREYDGD